MAETKKTKDLGAENADYLAAVDEGIADAKSGRVISYEKVRRWLLSWGSDKDVPPPKCP